MRPFNRASTASSSSLGLPPSVSTAFVTTSSTPHTEHQNNLGSPSTTATSTTFTVLYMLKTIILSFFATIFVARIFRRCLRFASEASLRPRFQVPVTNQAIRNGERIVLNPETGVQIPTQILQAREIEGWATIDPQVRETPGTERATPRITEENQEGNALYRAQNLQQGRRRTQGERNTEQIDRVLDELEADLDSGLEVEAAAQLDEGPEENADDDHGVVPDGTSSLNTSVVIQALRADPNYNAEQDDWSET